MSRGLWDLDERASLLDTTAESWSRVSRAMGGAASSFNEAARNALSDWEGEAATSFDEQQKALGRDLQRAAELSGMAASALQDAAGDIRSAQGHLDTSWSTVMNLPHTPGPYGSISFETQTPEEVRDVHAAESTAIEIRSELDLHLDQARRILEGTEADLVALAERWRRTAAGEMPWMDHIPAESSAVGILMVNGEAVVFAGSGDNNISVTIDPTSGDSIVVIDGASYRIPQGTPITLQGGGGDDTITLPATTSIGFTVVGGQGLDRIKGGGGADHLFGMGGNDEIQAGGGSDYASGGVGTDYIDGQDGDDRLFGGVGRDTLYGLGGSDHLSGGADQDFLEGGAEDDALYGGSGNDILSGGRGNDGIFGGAGSDISYGGRGQDRTIGGDGTDTSYDDARTPDSSNETNVTIVIPEDTSYIRIEGTPEFVARVQADLDLLERSPAGHELLTNLQENHDRSGFFGLGKNSFTIKEYVPADPNQPNSTASQAWPNQATIEYMPTIHDFRGAPPIVVLQHEFAHAYDYANGTFQGQPYSGVDTADTGIKVAERQATGLPIDHDGDPSTPEIIDPNHPLGPTENGLRAEMGLPKRESYR